MKKILAILLSAVLVLAFFGCETEPVTTSSNIPEASSEVISSEEVSSEEVSSEEVSSEEVSSEESSSEEVSSEAPKLPTSFSLYESTLKDLGKSYPNGAFMFHDLTGDGKDELIFKENMKVTIYTYSTIVEKLGSHDFVSDSTRLFVSDNADFPGMFVYHTGRGVDYYDYLNIFKGEVAVDNLWDEIQPDMLKYIADREAVVEYTFDKKLIDEFKRLLEADVDCSDKFVDINTVK